MRQGPLWSPEVQNDSPSVPESTFAWVKPVCWFFGSLFVFNAAPGSYGLFVAVGAGAALLFMRSRRRRGG